MGVEFKTKSISGHFPELWRGECKVLPGGFHPANEITTGTVVRTAALLCVDFNDMSAAVCKTGRVVNGGTTTAVRVMKGHYFAPGDSVGVNGGTKVCTVKSIATDNAEYDVITFDAAMTGVKADDILVETKSEALGENETVAPKYTPNMISANDKEFKTTGINTLDAAYDALVLIPSTAATPVLPEWLNGACLKTNPNILFINQ